MDSPGRRPDPDHSMGDSISVEGLGAMYSGRDETGSGGSAVISRPPRGSGTERPYFESDSPGRRIGVEERECESAETAGVAIPPGAPRSGVGAGSSSNSSSTGI